MDKKTLTAKLGVDGLCKGASTGIKWFASEKTKKLVSYSPVDNQPLGSIQCADAGDYERVMTAAEEAFLKWRAVPAPVRGEIVRKIALRIRENKENLGSLVSMEMGKILMQSVQFGSPASPPAPESALPDRRRRSCHSNLQPS